MIRIGIGRESGIETGEDQTGQGGIAETETAKAIATGIRAAQAATGMIIEKQDAMMHPLQDLGHHAMNAAASWSADALLRRKSTLASGERPIAKR